MSRSVGASPALASISLTLHRNEHRHVLIALAIRLHRILMTALVALVRFCQDKSKSTWSNRALISIRANAADDGAKLRRRSEIYSQFVFPERRIARKGK